MQNQNTSHQMIPDVGILLYPPMPGCAAKNGGAESQSAVKISQNMAATMAKTWLHGQSWRMGINFSEQRFGAFSPFFFFNWG